MGITHFFVKKVQGNKENCQNSCFSGELRESGGDGVLNADQRGKGRGKPAGDLREQVPRVPLGIPSHYLICLS